MFELKMSNVKEIASLSFSYCKFINEIDRLRGAGWIVTKIGYTASKQVGFKCAVFLVQDRRGVGFFVTDGYDLPKGRGVGMEIVQTMLKGASIAELQEIAPLKLL